MRCHLKPLGSAFVGFCGRHGRGRKPAWCRIQPGDLSVRITNLIRRGCGGRRPACARPLSPALKLGAEALQPVPARPAFIAAAGALRHDALEAELAAVREHDRALVRDRCAELNAVDSCDQARERVSPLLEGALAKIFALEAEKIEGDIGGSRAARLGALRNRNVRPAGTPPPRRRSGRPRRAGRPPPPRCSKTCR
jgi:hypothetical protein